MIISLSCCSSVNKPDRTKHRGANSGSRDRNRQKLHLSPNASVFRMFELWLRQNCSRFKYRPTPIKTRRDYVTLRFPALAPEIHCGIMRNGAVVAIEHKGETWDLLWDLDVKECRGARGFYCGFCEGADRKYFPSRRLLWEDHCFEPLLERINSLDETHWLYLFRTAGHSTYVHLGSSREMAEMHRQKNFVHAFPVVRRQTRNS